MATGLEVWIARPGNASAVDDQSWTVTVRDALYKVFAWKDVTYSGLPAPRAHWAGSIPPGTYIVRAVNQQGVATDHAIVMIECGDIKCVHLFVAGERRVKEPQQPDTPSRPERCAVTISGVIGRGGPDLLEVIEVSGTATGCQKVQVRVHCADNSRSAAVDVPVPAGGKWTAKVPNAELGCRCGGRLVVEARCTTHDDCRADTQRVERLGCA